MHLSASPPFFSELRSLVIANGVNFKRKEAVEEAQHGGAFDQAGAVIEAGWRLVLTLRHGGELGVVA